MEVVAVQTMEVAAVQTMEVAAVQTMEVAAVQTMEVVAIQTMEVVAVQTMEVDPVQMVHDVFTSTHGPGLSRTDHNGEDGNHTQVVTIPRRPTHPGGL